MNRCFHSKIGQPSLENRVVSPGRNYSGSLKMTALDFTDKEPVLKRGRAADAEMATNNAAFYERLQGQTKKKGIERFGWVALPVGAVAIFGVVALTSTPHKSADDVVGAPGAV